MAESALTGNANIPRNDESPFPRRQSVMSIARIRIRIRIRVCARVDFGLAWRTIEVDPTLAMRASRKPTTFSDAGVVTGPGRYGPISSECEVEQPPHGSSVSLLEEHARERRKRTTRHRLRHRSISCSSVGRARRQLK